MTKKKEKRQLVIAVSPRVHHMIREIAWRKRRTMKQQLEIWATKECQKLSIQTEN